MLVTSRPVALLERYRVPYRVEPASAPGPGVLRIARGDGSGVELLAVAGNSERMKPYLLDGAVLFGALAEDAARAGLVPESPISAEEPITDFSGVQHAMVQVHDDGSVVLPFDIDSVIDAFLDERYLQGSGRLRAAAQRGYYLFRPLIPWRAQGLLRRSLRPFQERAAFPSWPLETSLHRLEAMLLAWIEQVAGEPLPWLGQWPAPFEWTLVLTHDVERATGYANVGMLRELEVRLGVRSAWYFVPERDYRVEETLLDDLRASGCEIGLHGLRHDGRDLSPGSFPSRFDAMRRYGEKWGARGFRGPSTHRDSSLIGLLGIEHDSSWSDVARYEPQPGGCCSWFPFFIGDVVELPITLAQDHTLFVVREEADEHLWRVKTDFLREQGGMALMLTHPDYLSDNDRLSAYERFLEAYANDPSAWMALPHEVADWWRMRASTSIVRSAGTWVVEGPAKSLAQVRVGAPSLPPPSRAAAGATAS